VSVEHRDVFLREAFTKFGAGAFGSGEFGIGDNNEPGLKLIEQVIANWLTLGRQASDNDVRFQLWISVQQSVLAGPAKVRKQQDPGLAEGSENDDGAVIRLRKMVARVRMQNRPGADSIIAIDVPDPAGLAIKNVHCISVGRGAEMNRAGVDMLC